MKYRSILASALAILPGCSSSSQLPPQSTVAKVNLEKFMGRWYVIGNIPTMFEKGAHNATETYTWNAEKERIDIDYRYRKDAFDGKEKAIPQKAWVYDEKTKSEWRVQPIWPLKFAYLIIDLAGDYSDTMIGVPNREHVWIMAREPKLSAARYKELVEKARGFGYDVSKIEKVPQETQTQQEKRAAGR